MLGKEAGLFLPSGTMCNMIAIKAHTQPGDSQAVAPPGAPCRACPISGVPSIAWSTRTKPSLKARMAGTKAAPASSRATRPPWASCCARSSSPSQPEGYLRGQPETSTSDHTDEAQATARVYLPEYEGSRRALGDEEARARLRLPLRTNIPMPDQGAGLGEHRRRAIRGPGKLREPGPGATSSGARCSDRKRSPALRRQVADALTSVNAARWPDRGLSRLASCSACPPRRRLASPPRTRSAAHRYPLLEGAR